MVNWKYDKIYEEVSRYYSHEKFENGIGISPDVALDRAFRLDDFIKKYLGLKK
mgnify:CR=1 FL=1